MSAVSKKKSDKKDKIILNIAENFVLHRIDYHIYTVPVFILRTAD